MKKILMILSLALLLAPFTASAEQLPELTHFLRHEISKGGRAFATTQTQGQPAEDFFFRRWLLRLQATVGIEVPWIATFQIVPEVELVWQRPYPQGWTDYKPTN